MAIFNLAELFLHLKYSLFVRKTNNAYIPSMNEGDLRTNTLKNLPDDLSTARAETIAFKLNHETRGYQGIYIVVDC